MKIHLPILPWLPSTKEHSTCAYTQKCIRFADMMTSLGHEVFLYGGESTDTKDAELVTVVSAEDQIEMSQEFDPAAEHWTKMNASVIIEMSKRQEPGDILGVIAGHSQAPIAQAFPKMACVEWGIGYSGTFADCRVFESYAWMHAVYGWQQTAHGADGHFFDTVIPNSYHLDEVPFTPDHDGYLLYMGRLTERKGMAVVGEIAARTDRDVVIAGAGDESLVPAGATYVGALSGREKIEVLGGAVALLSPTLYIEPFGGITVEAMMMGVPVITTDWGCYTETVQQGLTGFRCRRLAEFMRATEEVEHLDRAAISEHAVARWDCEVVKHQYERYLEDIVDLHQGGGWYRGCD